MATTKEKKPSLGKATGQAAVESKSFPNEIIERAGKRFEKFIQDTKEQNERAAAINQRLQALGLDGLETREQFRDALRKVNPSTEDGAKRFVALMELAKDFASLTPPIEEAQHPEPKNDTTAPLVDNFAPTADHKDMTDLTRQEVDAKLVASEARVDARLANFDTSIKTGFAELRTEFAGFRTDMVKQTGEMRAEMAQIRVDMHKGMVDIIKWVVGFGIAILSAIFAFSKIADKPLTQGAVQPAPIVIYAQPGSPPSPPEVKQQPNK